MFGIFCGDLISVVWAFLMLYTFPLKASGLPPLASSLFLPLPPQMSSIYFTIFLIFEYAIIFAHCVPLSSQPNFVQSDSQNHQPLFRFMKYEGDCSCEECLG